MTSTTNPTNTHNHPGTHTAPRHYARHTTPIHGTHTANLGKHTHDANHGKTRQPRQTHRPPRQTHRHPNIPPNAAQTTPPTLHTPPITTPRTLTQLHERTHKSAYGTTGAHADARKKQNTSNPKPRILNPHKHIH